MRYAYDPSGNLTAAADIGPPEIIGHPASQIGAPGEAVTFSVVVADASGVTFQWRRDGVAIPAATGDSLVVADADAGAAGEGEYTVVVTNRAGSVTSAPAALLLDRDGDGLPDAWEAMTFGTTTAQRAEGDPDRDGVTNLAEFLDGTDPTRGTSLRPRLAAHGDPGGVVTVTPTRLSYALGETVTLTARPAASAVFVGWTGDLTGTDNPASVVMSGHRTIRARFATAAALPPGLVAFWRGEAGASDTIGARHGTFFAGATVTGPSVTADGKVGGAFAFDGTVHIRVPDSPALRPAQFTVEAWVHPTVATPAPQTVIARGSATSNDNAWYLGLFSGVPRFYSHGADLLPAPAAIPLNRWTHLAATFDGTTKRLYVDGRQVGAKAGLGRPVYEPGDVPVTIGADWVGGPDQLFNGRLDEVALYDRALTTGEIFEIVAADVAGRDLARPYFTSPTQLPDAVLGGTYTHQLGTVLGVPPVTCTPVAGGIMPPGVTVSPDGPISGLPTAPGTFDFAVLGTDAAGASTERTFVLLVRQPLAPPAGLVGWWKGDGNARDTIGTNHATLRNGTGFAGGRVGQAFLLDGTDDYVEIPDAPALRPTSVTLEAWVAAEAVTGLRVVIAKPVGGGPADSYALWLSPGALHGVVGDAAGNGPEVVAAFPPEPGRWYHLAYTFDDTTRRQVLYVDGAPVAAGPATRSIGYDAQPVLLGRDTENGVPNFFLDGRIDEASIYARALTGTEILAIYNAGPAGKRAPQG